MKKLIFIQSILFFSFCFSYPELRETISLSGEWQFIVDSTNRGFKENWVINGIPSAGSQTVAVPHTWNTIPGLENYAGTGWYQKAFRISSLQIKKLIRLQFDAVYHDAIVYINGQLAYKHIGSGYTRFFVDATPLLITGKNIVQVCADNSFSPVNIPYLNSFDWPNDGGIIRSVTLICTDKYAIQNVKLNTTHKGKNGIVNLKIKLLDSTLTDPSMFKFKVRIVEENQSTANQIFSDDIKTSYQEGYFITEIPLKNIKVWHFDNPNLYKMFITQEHQEKLIDEFSSVFGFRTINTENNRIMLNGEPVRLMGLEWMPGSTLERGMAENYDDLEKNLKLMKNVNCVFSRFHWQQDEYVFDWCDRNGILLQEEIPYWGGVTMLNDTLLQLGYQHLDEMIDAHFNHPSIFAWGIGNELQSHDTLNIQAFKNLYAYAKKLDPSRFVNYVSNQLGWHKSENEGLEDDASCIGDVMHFNEYYSTWYGETIESVPSHLQKIFEDYPDKPLVISEWGLCEPYHTGGDSRRIDEMKRQIKMYSASPNITGAIYFCLNDYRTHMGEDKTYNYPQRVHGVVDINLIPKASYEVLKEISSPIIISEQKETEVGIELTLSGNTGIPSYIVENYNIEAGDWRDVIIKLEPGKTQTIHVKKGVKEVIIKRPTGFEVLRVKFK